MHLVPINFSWKTLGEGDRYCLRNPQCSLYSASFLKGGCSVHAQCWQASQRPEDRRRHTQTKRERCSVCGQGSWCNWCNGCLSFLLRCHSLMTRPSSSGSLWQNTGTRSAGRRLSDSAAVADAFLPPVRPSLCPPFFLPPTLVCLFDICLYLGFI